MAKHTQKSSLDSRHRCDSSQICKATNDQTFRSASISPTLDLKITAHVCHALLGLMCIMNVICLFYHGHL